MLRKRFRGVVLAAAVAAAAFEPWSAEGQSPASQTSATLSGSTSLRPAIWAATAEYVYKDDRDLAKIQPELLKTIKRSSVAAFNHSIDEAVGLENKQRAGQKHLLKFQELVKTVQAQPLDSNDPTALVKAIVNKLDDNKERMADPARAQQLALLTQHLDQLAAGAAPTVATATAPPSPTGGPAVPDPSPADISAAPESATVTAPLVAVPAMQTGSSAPAWVSWLALILSGLSFVGMMLLFRKQNQPVAVPVPTLPPAHPERATRQSSRKEPNVSWDEMRKYVERQMDERLNPAAPSVSSIASAPAPAPPQLDEVEAMLAPLPSPVSAPGPRQRTQYANEAPFNNSFPARALSDQPGTYSMFAIVSSEQQPEQGSFAVTGNLASHVRDHRSVLEPVCEYVGGYPLGSESRVITVEPGTVRRRGDDWEVVQRAKVRFE